MEQSTLTLYTPLLEKFALQQYRLRHKFYLGEPEDILAAMQLGLLEYIAASGDAHPTEDKVVEVVQQAAKAEIDGLQRSRAQELTGGIPVLDNNNEQDRITNEIRGELLKTFKNTLNQVIRDLHIRALLYLVHVDKLPLSMAIESLQQNYKKWSCHIGQVKDLEYDIVKIVLMQAEQTIKCICPELLARLQDYGIINGD